MYLSTGVVTRFSDARDPKPRFREVFGFHKPETIQGWIKNDKSLRASLADLPALPAEGLRDCQINAITKREASFKANKPRALIRAMVACVGPEPRKAIADPSCGKKAA